MHRRTVLRTAGLFGMAGLAGCLGSTSFRSTATEESTPDSPGPPAWSIDVTDPVVHAPTVSRDTVYVGTEGGQIHALSASDGNHHWTSSVQAPIAGTPVHRDGLLFVVVGHQGLGSNHRIIAIDATSGDRRWTATPGSWWLTIHGADERAVYVSTQDDAIGQAGQTLFAFATADGHERWRTEVGDSYGSVVADDTLIVASFSRLYAIDTADGRERWRVNAGRFERPYSLGEMVVVRAGSSRDASHVRAYDLAGGKERWRFDRRSVTSMTVGVAPYAGGRRLTRIDPDSGTAVWQAEHGHPSFIPGTPVSDDVVVAGGDGVAAYGLEDGVRRWTFTPERSTDRGYMDKEGEPVPELLIPEVIEDGTVFVRGAGNEHSLRRIYAIDPTRGRKRWRFVADGTLTSMVGGSNHAFVGSRNGTVYAFAADA